jgi:gliding motility-associated-like protein
MNWILPNGSIINSSNLNIPNITTSMAGVYASTYTGGDCPGDTASFNVNIQELPDVQLFGSASACFGDTVMFNAQSISTVEWMNGITGFENEIIADSSQWISVSTTTFCGTALDSMYLLVNPLPISNAGQDQLIYVGNHTQLNGYGTGDYLWTPNIYLSCNNCPNPVVSPNATTNYVLTITDDNGCIQTDTVTIHVEVYGTCYAPNGFTPNADGLNDVFHVIVNDAAQVEFNVFNRWGELIYSTNTMGQGWDGYFKGELCPQSTYVWRATGVYLNGEAFSFMGEVTLVP